MSGDPGQRRERWLHRLNATQRQRRIRAPPLHSSGRYGSPAEGGGAIVGIAAVGAAAGVEAGAAPRPNGSRSTSTRSAAIRSASQSANASTRTRASAWPAGTASARAMGDAHEHLAVEDVGVAAGAERAVEQGGAGWAVAGELQRAAGDARVPAQGLRARGGGGGDGREGRRAVRRHRLREDS